MAGYCIWNYNFKMLSLYFYMKIKTLWPSGGTLEEITWQCTWFLLASHVSIHIWVGGLFILYFSFRQQFTELYAYKIMWVCLCVNIATGKVCQHNNLFFNRYTAVILVSQVRNKLNLASVISNLTMVPWI